MVCFYFLDDTTEVSPIEASKDPDSNAISLADFDLIRVIGRGSYAKVLMVELKKTKRIYAMKVIKKELVTDDEVSGFFFTNISILGKCFVNNVHVNL